VVNFARMVKQCKVDGEALLGTQRVHQVCRAVGHRWRDGKLPPATTVLGMMQQVAHANVSCAAVRQMHGGAFTAEAFCQAKQRLPLTVLLELNKGLAQAAMHQAGKASCSSSSSSSSSGGSSGSGQWKGRHRVFVIDGSSFVVPETPELREHFGLRSNQKPGCSDPSCHLLLQLGPGGAATAAICSPYRTGDMTHVGDRDVQDSIGAGDVVLGDRLLEQLGTSGAAEQQRRVRPVQGAPFAQDCVRPLQGPRPQPPLARQAGTQRPARAVSQAGSQARLDEPHGI